jgi:anti-sigma factor RsiW
VPWTFPQVICVLLVLFRFRSDQEDNVSNDSMNCGQVKRLLPSSLDEELSGRVREQIASHLASCPACRAESEALKADMGLLEQLGTPEVSPFLVTRVMAEIRQSAESEGRSRALGVWRSVFGVSLGRLVGSLAAAIVVAVSIGAGVFFGSGLAQASTTAATNSTEAAVSYVESSAADMYSMMSGGD